MATYSAWGPIDEVNGAIGTDKTCVCRRKHYKIDDKGHTIEGSKEIYKVCHPRNYKKKPQMGQEKESSEAFSQARQLRIRIQTEMPEVWAHWHEAYLHQIQHPDEDSPMIGGKRKRYIKIDNYVETKLRLRGMRVDSY